MTQFEEASTRCEARSKLKGSYMVQVPGLFPDIDYQTYSLKIVHHGIILLSSIRNDVFRRIKNVKILQKFLSQKP